MSSGINKVILIGNLGRDPEVRFLPNGLATASVSLATAEQWKDRDTGEKQERTEWHRVVFFGKLAEVVGQWLKKGSKIYVEGKLRTRKWQDQQGQDRYTTEVVVDMRGTMQMLGAGPGRQGGPSTPSPAETTGSAAAGPSEAARAYQAASGGAAAPGAASGGGAEFDDDIPF